MSWGGTYRTPRKDGLAPETEALIRQLGTGQGSSRRRVEATLQRLQDAKRGGGTTAARGALVAVPRPTGRAPPPRLPPSKLGGRKKVQQSELEREQYTGQGTQGQNREHMKDYLAYTMAHPSLSRSEKEETRARIAMPAAAFKPATGTGSRQRAPSVNPRVEELERHFAQVQAEIEERGAFLEEMEAKGLGAKYAKDVADQVRQRVETLKRIDVLIDEELGKAKAPAAPAEA